MRTRLGLMVLSEDDLLVQHELGKPDLLHLPGIFLSPNVALIGGQHEKFISLLEKVLDVDVHLLSNNPFVFKEMGDMHFIYEARIVSEIEKLSIPKSTIPLIHLRDKKLHASIPAALQYFGVNPA